MAHTKVQPAQELLACPQCGSKFAARGTPISVVTPRLFRPLYRIAGITCVQCGFHSSSMRKWNKLSAAAPPRQAPSGDKRRFNGVIIYAFGEDGKAVRSVQIPNSALSARTIWAYMEGRYLPLYRASYTMEKAWYRPEMTDYEFMAANGRKPSRLDTMVPSAMDEIFRLTEREDIPENERLVLATTIDGRLLHADDGEAVIKAFREFPVGCSLAAQADVIEHLLQGNGTVAIGWKQGPFYGNDWMCFCHPDLKILDANAPEYNCVTGKFHTWICRSGKEPRP